VNIKKQRKYFYHQNELNSIEGLSDENGQGVERYEYDPYGKPTVFDANNNKLQNSIVGNKFGFTGQEYDEETNNYAFFFRNYSTSTGSFFQRDPLGYADGTALYQYVHDNPANAVDMLGLAGDNFEFLYNFFSPTQFVNTLVYTYVDKRATVQSDWAFNNGDNYQSQYNTVSDPILISNEEFNNEVYRMRQRMDELYNKQKQNYYKIGKDWDSKWHTGNLAFLHIDPTQRFCFNGRIVYGHELNYLFLGMLTRYTGHPYSEGAVISTSWKLAHYNQLPSKNTVGLYSMGYYMSDKVGSRLMPSPRYGLPNQEGRARSPRFEVQTVNSNGQIMIRQMMLYNRRLGY
jgi:RHS repeat-associated protein